MANKRNWRTRLSAKLTSWYIYLMNKVRKPPRIDIDQYPVMICSFETMVQNVATGDLLLNGGHYPVGDFIRAQFHAKTSHAGLVWIDPESNTRYCVSSFVWGHLPPNRQPSAALMKCRIESTKHDGVQIHPLEAYLDAAMSLSNEWLLWRPLFKRDEINSKQNDVGIPAKPEGATLDTNRDEPDESTKIRREFAAKNASMTLLSRHVHKDLADRFIHWIQQHCQLPFPSPNEMYRRQKSAHSLNNLRRISKVGRKDSMHCSEAVARCLTDADVLKAHLSLKQLDVPAHAVVNVQLEDGGLIDQGWLRGSYVYSKEIWVRKPAVSMFDEHGALKSASIKEKALTDPAPASSRILASSEIND